MPWSYSHLDKFETCARQFYHVKVLQDVVEPPTVHTSWGKDVHTALEERVMNGTHLPEGMEQWDLLAGKIEDLPGAKHAEIQLAINSAFQPAPWGTAWSRGIVYLLILAPPKAVVLDWKTGKFKPSEQIELYVAYVFAHYPEVEEVSGLFVWLKSRKISRQTYQRADIPTIWRKLLPRIARLEAAYEQDTWLPTPSGLCNGWCPVQSCQYWKGKR